MDGRGKPFGPQVAAVDRRAEIVQLRAERLTFEQIGKALGIDKSNAKRGFDKALADANDRCITAVEAYKAQELAVLSAVRVRLLGILNANHPYVSEGRVVARVHDVGPNLAAARELRQNSERISKLLGLDAPTRKVVEVLTEDVIDAAIRQELAAMEALDAAGAAADRAGTAAETSTSA